MAEGIRLELAIRQIEAARQYTLTLLDGLRDEDWFVPAPSGITHIAWQVGHLAMAEYGLCLFRRRGRRPEDLELMSGKFRKRFRRGSTPVSEPSAYPAPNEIRAVLDRVHRQAMAELAACCEEDLNEKIEEPYAVYDTKLGALLFCAHHEMLHAGQIGLVRRLIGKAPVR